MTKEETLTATVTPIGRKRSWRANLATVDDVGPVEEFLDRFVVHLRAASRSDNTIKRYWRAARQLGEYLAGADLATVTGTDMEGYIVARRAATSPATAAADFWSLQQFFKFVALDLARTGVTFASPMTGMAAPRFVAPTVAVIEDDTLSALVRRAEAGKEFEDLRDTALLRIFIDTGCRLGEVTGLTLNGIVNAPVLVVMGKSKGHGPVPREVEIGDRAARALRRYMRARAAHPLAESTAVWLSRKGILTPSGVQQIIKRRSRAAGAPVHPHMFRHTKADSFLSGGGSEGDLMKLMGWDSDEMTKRYGAARAGQRALEAQRAMGFPGDKL